jgi:hypothetical protein
MESAYSDEVSTNFMPTNQLFMSDYTWRYLSTNIVFDEGQYYTNINKVLNSFTLRWSPNGGYLQYNTNLAYNNWLDYPVTNNPVIISNIYPQCFFRLKPATQVVITNNYIFGNTNNGLSIDTLYDVIPYINATRFRCASNKTFSTFVAKLPADMGRYKFAVYSDSNGNINSLLGQSVEIINPTNGWNSAAAITNITLSNNTYYWLAAWSDSANGRIYYSDVNNPLKWAGLAYGPWPSSISTSGGGNASYCIYLR